VGYIARVSDRAPSDESPSTLLSNEGTPWPVTQAKEPTIGARLGQFRVEARIGRGGRGIVYQAYDEKLRRPVALKILVDASSGSSVWLLEEARAAAALMHPSIAAIHDVQQQEGVVFIVMELVSGTTLRAELQRGPLPLATTLRYARDIASGLARAHRSGIVHRDLKPENVMVTPEGNAKILDFGLARVAPDIPPPSGEAGATGIAGTPGYMAPEQAAGRRVDTRADVFSFGVLLWEMIAGKRPFGRPALGANPRSETWKPVAALDQLAPDAPRELLQIVERCLAIEPGARFANADEVLLALGSLRGAILEPPPSLAWAKRRSVLVALTFTAASALLVGGALRYRWRPPTESPPGPPPAATVANAGHLALTSAAEPLTTQGLCSSFPAFADDGSLVYSRQDEDGAEIHRLDLVSGTDKPLTADGAESLRPAPGPAGQIVYLFQKKGEEGGGEVRSVSLSGLDSTTVTHGTDAAFASGAIYFLEDDGRGIRRHVIGGAEELLYETASSSIFRCLSTSPDGRWLVTSEGSTEPRPSAPVCFAPIGGEHTPLDCTAAGTTTSNRETFSPKSDAVYFGRGEAIVRFDLKSHTAETVRLSPAPTTLAVAPDSASLIFSTCRTRYDALRVESDGRTTPLHVFDDSAGLIYVGPRGELAFPIVRGAVASLAITDPAASSFRVMTSEDHNVTEIAFSPDGRRVAFHDSTPDTGGLFVVNIEGPTVLTRVTTDPEDSLPGWLDTEHVVYMHPEKGLPYGRISVVPAAGGEPRILPKFPGLLLGAVPSRGKLLLAIRSPSGDRLAEATLDGKVHEIDLRGAPKGMRWDVATSASPSGRYVAWYSGGAVWRADLDAGVASRVDFAWPRGVADAIQPDDEGRIAVSFRHSEGQLFRLRGSFP
jgi:serine/threonine protein kinase